MRTIGGHRRYRKDEIEEKLGIKEVEEKYTICYSRVSSNDQKDDLERQREELREYCEKENDEKIIEIKEIGSGLNYKKRGFIKLLNLILTGNIKKIVVSYKDRLLRFGSEIIEQICSVKNISLVIINETKEVNFEEKLAQDIITILTVFCSKIYGKRSHMRRKKKLKTSKE